MRPEDAFNALQKQELLHKFVEIGKVLLTWAILKNVDMVSLIYILIPNNCYSRTTVDTEQKIFN